MHKLEKAQKKDAIEQRNLGVDKAPKEQTFDKAVAKLYKQVKNFDSYKEAVKLQKELSSDMTVYQRGIEVAIELIKRIFYYSATEVGRYRVDLQSRQRS